MFKNFKKNNWEDIPSIDDRIFNLILTLIIFYYSATFYDDKKWNKFSLLIFYPYGCHFNATIWKFEKKTYTWEKEETHTMINNVI